MMNRLSVLVILVFTIWCIGCSEKPPQPASSGKVVFNVRHYMDGIPLVKNDRLYTNKAGNEYIVIEVKYFISDITFHQAGGSGIVIQQWKDIFYIDEDIPDSKTIRFYDPIPTGKYDSISFIFGISGEKNISFMFVNPPEVNMFWPEVLGGGYHYMMINGKWKNPEGQMQPFDFHLGIGQLYHGDTYDTDSIYAFVQNYFRISFPCSSFTMENGQTMNFYLTMNMESWFTTPNVFDFNFWGGSIMQNQAAMQAAKENGGDVFTLSNNRE